MLEDYTTDLLDWFRVESDELEEFGIDDISVIIHCVHKGIILGSILALLLIMYLLLKLIALISKSNKILKLIKWCDFAAFFNSKNHKKTFFTAWKNHT